MNKALRILAIVMLLVTIVGAAAVLYGINTLAPQVVQISSVVTPAASAPDVFDQTLEQVMQELFSGKVYQDPLSLDAKACSFVTYTARLKNRGFFPAEWISLEVQPVTAEGGQDILVLDSGEANVLPSGAQGDVSVTLLTSIAEPQPPRMIEISCYVFGRKQTVVVQAD